MGGSYVMHVDDLGCALGTVAAFEELVDAGSVTSGSVMVPAAWFPAVAELTERRPDLDVGVHLTLTSETAAFRWRPLSTTSRASGLIDEDGYMWSTTPLVQAHGHPDAVEQELRSQIDLAQKAGIAVSHLDHHMGAALSPEFVEYTVSVAIANSLPTLFPTQLDSFVGVLDVGFSDTEKLADARRRLAAAGLARYDRFVMGLSYQGQDPREAFLEILTQDPDCETFVSLHCASPGDIELVHPNDADWRIAEYELLRSPEFAAQVKALPVRRF